MDLLALIHQAPYVPCSTLYACMCVCGFVSVSVNVSVSVSLCVWYIHERVGGLYIHERVRGLYIHTQASGAKYFSPYLLPLLCITLVTLHKGTLTKTQVLNHEP